MPVDFISLKEYTINYNTLYDFFHEQKIFSNPHTQKNYLTAWIRHISEADKDAISEFRDPKIKQIILQALTDEPELFQQPFHFAFGTILIQFRISRLIELLKTNNYQDHVEYISYKEFTDSGTVFWTAPDNFTENLSSGFPILITELIGEGKHNQVVIDGNHRLNYYIHQKSQRIPVLTINPQTLIDNNLFVNRFDKYYYIFQNEMCRLANMREYDQMPDEALHPLSFLNGNGYQFNNLS
ncbi:hypothetical protein [Listeria riparia]|uniref:Uncharacterized protein n=1 Tax=Listeria riparia FSL S10-1204 TaxID=1265816 RepID=W7CTG1_9LIST|nr:hypothetical protein [Listeria riparia]EUJ42934.1 hypothetical protein PRIP_14812 [Listeria riparia FSL S10-1204]